MDNGILAHFLSDNIALGQKPYKDTRLVNLVYTRHGVNSMSRDQYQGLS